MPDNFLGALQPCPACGAESWQLLPEHTRRWRVNPPGQLYKCPKCHLLAVWPQPSLEISEDIFNDASYYQNVVGKKDAFFQERVEFIKRVATPSQKKLLDIGCALGDLLDVATRQGFDAEGIEFSEYACKYARDIRGLRVSKLSVEQLPDAAYDIVHANHVLEHVYSPLIFMMNIKRILRPEGICIIEVPNEFSNLMTKLNIWLGRAWGRPVPTIHLFFFNPTALEQLALRAGFGNTSVTTWTPRVTAQEGGISSSYGTIARNCLRALADKATQGTNIVLLCHKP